MISSCGPWSAVIAASVKRARSQSRLVPADGEAFVEDRRHLLHELPRVALCAAQIEMSFVDGRESVLGWKNRTGSQPVRDRPGKTRRIDIARGGRHAGQKDTAAIDSDLRKECLPDRC